MTQVRVENGVHERLQRVKKQGDSRSLSEAIETLLDDADADAESELFDRLGLTAATELPSPVGNALYGDATTQVHRTEETIPRVARFFVAGMWLLNEQFATTPEYVDVVLVNDGALLRHQGSIEHGQEVTHFFVDRDDYDSELTTMLRSDGCEFLLPPGGIPVEWRAYPGTVELPTRACEWGGAQRWPVIGYGYGDTTREDVALLTRLRTVGEAVRLDGHADKQAYEKRVHAHTRRSEQATVGDTTRSVPVFSDIHVDEPDAVFEAFFDWCLQRSDWSLRDGLDSPQDAFAMPPAAVVGTRAGTDE